MNNKFYFIKEFYVKIPADYDAKSQLTRFSAQNEDKFTCYDSDITNQEEYSNPSHPLSPNKTYKIIVWGINEGLRATSTECLQLLQENNCLLVGAPGLSVIWQQDKEEFTKGKWFASFDEEDKLWKDAVGDHRVPGLEFDSAGDWSFGLYDFETDLGDRNCVVGFCDYEVSES